MNITLTFGDKEVLGYEQLISCYPEKEFDSPLRSTIPHLLFWRIAETRFPEICKYIGATPSSSAHLSFEFQVKPLYGRGKASHTDLMLAWDNHYASIVAKYLEPEYDTVEQWIEKGNCENRLMVLKGWCDLLAGNTGCDLKVDDVKKVNYQLLHRAASACSFNSRTRYIICEVFQDEGDKKGLVDYPKKMRELLNLLKPGSIRGIVLRISIKSTAKYEQLKNQWRSGNRHLSQEVLEGLRIGGLIGFGEPEVIEVD